MHELYLPPGFRFHPSDEELVTQYLQNKLLSIPLPAKIVTEIELYKYNPWDLPSKALFGEKEWFFFTPRDRKYPNGNRPNRAAGTGYWKATGTDKHVLSSCGTKRVGLKKALVFYRGRPPKGIKTDWIMTEYRLVEAMISWASSSITDNSKKKGSMRLDDWVLCRIRNKSSNKAKKMCPSENTSEEPRSSFQNLDHGDDNDGQRFPKPIVDYDLSKDFPMLPYIFATSQHQLLNDTPKSRKNDSETGFQFSSVSVSDESLFSNLQPNMRITKNMEYHHLMNISPNSETLSFFNLNHQIKGQPFVNDDHDWNNDTNFQYDYEVVQNVNWEIL